MNAIAYDDEDLDGKIQSVGRLLSRPGLAAVIDGDCGETSLPAFDVVKGKTRDPDLLPLYFIACGRENRYSKSSMNVAGAVLEYLCDAQTDGPSDGQPAFCAFRSDSMELLDELESERSHDLHSEPVDEILRLLLPLLLIVFLSRQINDPYIIGGTIEKYAAGEDYKSKINDVTVRYHEALREALDDDAASKTRRR